MIGLHVRFLNKALRMNLKARLYKILLLWSPSDEQQQNRLQLATARHENELIFSILQSLDIDVSRTHKYT